MWTYLDSDLYVKVVCNVNILCKYPFFIIHVNNVR